MFQQLLKKNPKKKYKVPISLWFVDQNQRFSHLIIADLESPAKAFKKK